VSWHGVNHGKPPASRCWNIGITIAPPYRGRGVGTEAQRLLAAYLLATTTVNRIEADTDVTNLAEQRSLEKAGFTREGTMRGAQFREGAWHDMVLFSRLRHD
jgi:RimJ/RimL family protein N-acetyltransferase